MTLFFFNFQYIDYSLLGLFLPYNIVLAIEQAPPVVDDVLGMILLFS